MLILKAEINLKDEIQTRMIVAVCKILYFFKFLFKKKKKMKNKNQTYYQNKNFSNIL